MKAQNKLILETLQKEDLTNVIKTLTFPWSSLQATQEKWERYYTEQQTNIRTVCIAKIGDEFIGYVSLLKNTEYPNFKNLGIPEINDVCDWGQLCRTVPSHETKIVSTLPKKLEGQLPTIHEIEAELSAIPSQKTKRIKKKKEI